MQGQDFTRRLRFNAAEYHEMLARIEARCGPAVNVEGRARTRYPFPVADLPLLVDHPEGGRSRFLVFGRNISRCGMSVLHGGFIHSGSKIEIALARKVGDPLRVLGEVRHCRLFSGSCHEIGIRFESEIDPGALTGSEAEPEAAAPKRHDLPQAAGSVLVVESFAPDHLLLEHHLRLIGLSVQIAETPGAAIDAVKQQKVDAILFGLSLHGKDGLRTLAALRSARYEGPIVLLTGVTDGDLLSQARNAGASVVMQKPFNIDLLLAQIRVFLGGAMPRGPYYSSAEGQPGMPSLIEQYVELIRRIADQLLRSYKDQEWPELIEYCRQLRGSGCSFGFQGLSIAAIAALDALEREPAGAKARETLATLVEACRSLEISAKARSA